MNCPTCTTEITPERLTLEDNEEEIEIGFTCPTCLRAYFCLVTSRSFVPVD